MTEQQKTTEESTRLDRILATTLRTSAYVSFAVAVVGLVLQFQQWSHADDVLRAAIIFLLITPALRIAVMVAVFFRNRELKYALIAFVVLAILIGSAMLGIKLE